MPSTYSPRLRLELQATGENDTTWGAKANNVFETIEYAIAGAATIVMADADYTLTEGFGVSDEARNAIILVTGPLTAQRSVICGNQSKTYIVKNATSGGFPITIKTSAGTGVSIVNGASATVYCDGTNVELAQTPTADGSITPQKIDQTATYAWRFNGAFGIGRAQPYVANYGVLSMDGTTGSYISLYQGGAQVGTVSATASAFDMSSPDKTITFTTNGVTRLSIATTGTVTVAGTIAASAASVTGTTQTTTLSVTGNATVGGTVTAAGFNGLTHSNIVTGLQYKPVENGTGVGQSSAMAVKLGWNTTSQRLKATVENLDLGNIVFDNTPGVFIPSTNALGNFEFAAPQQNGFAVTCPIIIRETNRSTTNAAPPRIGFIWSGVAGGQIMFDHGGGFHFVNDSNSARANIVALGAILTNGVLQDASDDRLKDRRGYLSNVRQKLRKLASFYYVNNSTASDAGLTNRRMQIGWSAQQLEQDFPELVYLAPCDDDGNGKSKSGNNYKTVRYERAAPILSAAINEHDELIEIQALEIQRLHDTVTVLMNRLAAMETKQK